MNNKEFDRLFHVCRSYCMSRLINLTSSEIEAEEVFMEAFCRFWVAFRQGKVKHQDRIEAYVHQKAKWLWYDRKRKSSRDSSYSMEAEDIARVSDQKRSMDDEEFDPMIRAEEEQQRTAWKETHLQAFKQAFEKLTEQCRQLLTKSIIDKIRMEAICKDLGYKNAETAKAAKYKCKKRLKALMQK